MAEYFTNNRQLIKDLKINTGSTDKPTWSSLCCASEMTLNMDVNSDDFYVWCDAVQRHIQSGMALTLETTLKVDAENEGIQSILTKIQTAMTSGSLVTLDNVQIKFDVLKSYATNTLTYETYTATATMVVEALGGSAEDSAEIGVTFNINGPLTTANSTT